MLGWFASASIMNPPGDTSEVPIPGLPLTACHPHYLLHPQWGSHHVVLEANIWYVAEDWIAVTVVSLVKEHRTLTKRDQLLKKTDWLVNLQQLCAEQITSDQLYSAREMCWLTQDCSSSSSRVILSLGSGCSSPHNMPCSSRTVQREILEPVQRHVLNKPAKNHLDIYQERGERGS